MTTIISTLIMIHVMYSIIKNYDKGIKKYILAIFLAPVFNFGFIRIEFFLVSIIPIMFVVFMVKKKIYINSMSMAYITYLIVALISTLLSSIKYNILNFQIIAVVGILLRIFFIIVLTESTLKLKDFLDIMNVILIINTIVVLIQLLIKSSVVLFYSLYYSESMTPLVLVQSLGYFNRAYGTFPTPIFLGIFSVVYIAFNLFENQNKKMQIFYLGMAIMIGMCSLTKTFVLGLVVVVLFFAFDRLILKQFLNKKWFFAFFVLAFLGVFIVYELNKQGLFIFWYINYIIHPFDALASRYDSTKGILSATIRVIRENPILGIGFNNIYDEFTGDSFYYSVLHDVGYIGMLSFIILFISIIFEKSKLRIHSFYKILVMALLGVGAGMFLEPFTIVFLYIVYIEKKDLKSNKKNKILLSNNTKLS